MLEGGALLSGEPQIKFRIFKDKSGTIWILGYMEKHGLMKFLDVEVVSMTTPESLKQEKHKTKKKRKKKEKNPKINTLVDPAQYKECKKNYKLLQYNKYL